MNDAERDALQRIVNHSHTKGMMYTAIAIWSVVLFISSCVVGLVSFLLWLNGHFWLGLILTDFLSSGGYCFFWVLIVVIVFCVYKANEYYKLTRVFFRSSSGDCRIDFR